MEGVHIQLGNNQAAIFQTSIQRKRGKHLDIIYANTGRYKLKKTWLSAKKPAE